MISNKIFFTLLSLTFLVSCNEVKTEKVAKKKVELKTKSVSALSSTSSYYSAPDTFTMFFMPTKDTMPTNSKLFSLSDDMPTKIAKITNELLKLSDKYDEESKGIYEDNKEKTKIEKDQEDNNCTIDDTPQTCKDLQKKLDDVNAKIDTKNKAQSKFLEDIQKTLDTDIAKPVNWLEYGTAKDYKFEIDEANYYVKNITLPTLGKGKNRYTIKDGDIFDAQYVDSEYREGVKILKFKLYEKDESKVRTGYTYEFKLEKSYFLNKLRFKGDVIKKDPSGIEVTRGTCKFELPSKT